MTPEQPHSHDKDFEREADRRDAEHKAGEKQRKRHDELLDEGIEETFPASDPVAVKHIS